MAISKFGLLAVSAVMIGGVTAGLAQTETTPPAVQLATEHRTAPVAAIANPDSSFRTVAVEFTSGKAFGRVVAISTNGVGCVFLVCVVLNDMPSVLFWL